MKAIFMCKLTILGKSKSTAHPFPIGGTVATLQKCLAAKQASNNGSEESMQTVENQLKARGPARTCRVKKKKKKLRMRQGKHPAPHYSPSLLEQKVTQYKVTHRKLRCGP